VTAVVVSAPDHWHALAALWAAERGKHVYVEKPVSHNLLEGRRMVQAARKYKVVVQAGTQRRSSANVAAAREFVQAGKLGKVAFARAWIAGSRKPIGKKPDEPAPKGVDYDLFRGPAPERPFNPNRFHYNWHWFWETGTGELGNNGIHGLDQIRNVLELDAPTRVASMGGKYVFDDDQETPGHPDRDVRLPRVYGRVGAPRVGEERPGEDVVRGDPARREGDALFDKDGWHVRDGEERRSRTARTW
jgi:predicted dehydrogenase